MVRSGLDGREYGGVDIAAGRELAAEVGWSPDGRFLAAVPWTADGPSGGFAGHGMFLWQAGDVATVDGAGHLALEEQHTTTRRTLSRFDTGRTCELHTQPCRVFDLHLATGLLSEVTVRDADRPRRGGLPWPTIVTGAALLGVAVLLWRRGQRRATGSKIH
ncbi:hypothetical protein [Asanoa sp. NPDC050611]|uniref:hypothetical protein n=1 Tax=Asanoa sp. NPDC050611 TaxID=3157098 RepID=UPI0033CDDB37